MKKALALLGVTATLAVGTSASAQVVWEDNFDSYETGSAIDGQGGWEPWEGSTLVSTVSDTQARSAPNSIEITGADDLVRQYTDYTTGVYAYTAWQYIPGEGSGAISFILLNNYPAAANPDWSVATTMD
ncbi:MAG: hypothetical protein HKO59_02720, partial [Phycisphaerales bacterium]|nr:hypothetical protein [Phycisphaerales bacterium]